ncbi:MAG: bacteriohopanetetrol glucosamine biosynthesis glycosyltransferase HpnI [Acidobacteria bacterium]|nr:bacteriohopanetetrol glucosamine biosynthesis glycosyltransferase HpnI [Acidobacteriota bacterium]
MAHHFVNILTALAALATLAGLGYCGLGLWSAGRFLRDRQDKESGPPLFAPAVSILKPLKGADPRMYESFRSHCLQEYPGPYEILFGVSDPHDSAIELVRRLQVEFPRQSIRLVLCANILGTNVKVSNLAQMVEQAQFDHLLVNDSDIAVPPDYLRRVLSPFASPQVGMVTCLYRGEASPTLGSRLESLGISTDFALGVLVARQTEGMRFGLGSTLAFRRDDLRAIGGFEALLDYLADDYELGNRIARLGKSVELAEFAVDTHLPPYTLTEFWQHQLRWARSIRDSRRWGYLGYAVTFVLPWALSTLFLAQGASWAWGLLGAALVLRVGSAVLVGNSVLHDRTLFRHLWLLPLRDLIGLLVWLVSFAGHTVVWRGDTFLLKEGKLRRIS